MLENVNFYNDPLLVQSMRPLSYYRSLDQLWLGTSTIQDKWKSFIPNSHQPANTYLSILGSLLPDQAVVSAISQLEHNTVLVQGQQVLAFTGSGPRPSQDSPFSDKRKVEYAGKARWIQHPEDLLMHQAEVLQQEIQPAPFDVEKYQSLGNTILSPSNCFIHPSAQLKGCMLDASSGPIYVGEDVNLQMGTIIQGPVAFLKGSTTNLGAKIRPNTTIGPGCKVGGEINHSIFFPFSNKAHEGYIGSSVIGAHSNMGALTSNSNLKNDLKPVAIFDYSLSRPRNTGIMALGLIMGDFVTTGIHSKFNTGSVIGCHCNISSQGFLPKFIPSFTWGEYPKVQTYQMEKAKQVASQWINLKHQAIPENLAQVMEEIWKEEASFRT
ncbi:putative sugar nucleotidyl transferase [Aquirufa nivalisilvae]